jgi:hypothetical protein
MTNDRPKGYLTLRFAGLFFILSAVLEVASVTAEVPLFGAMRGGLPAILYHLVYVLVFTVVGAGLWQFRAWCPMAVLAGTLFLSVDRLVFLLGDRTLRYEQLLGMVEAEMLDSVVLTATATTIVCWWGFAVYVFMRRDSFGEQSHQETIDPVGT